MKSYNLIIGKPTLNLTDFITFEMKPRSVRHCLSLNLSVIASNIQARIFRSDKAWVRRKSPLDTSTPRTFLNMKYWPKKYRDRRCKGLKQRHLFVVACCVCFVLFCLGCPEQLIKLFPNSPGQARQDTGQEVSIYRQNRTDCLSSFQYFTPPISILLVLTSDHHTRNWNISRNRNLVVCSSGPTG